MTLTTKLQLPLPAGSDVVSRSAYGDALPLAIDANAASQAQADQPFHLDSVTYDAGNNRLVCVLASGRAMFPGGVLVSLGAQTAYINSPATSTAYYLYLTSGGTFTSNLTGVPVAGAVLLWKIATASNLSNPSTLTDQRGQLPGAPNATTTVTTTATSYTVAPTDTTIVANVVANNITLLLPPATGSNRLLWIRKVSAGHTLTLTANGGDQIDETGGTTLVLAAANAYDGRLLCDTQTGVWRVFARGGDDAATLDGVELLANKTLAAPIVTGGMSVSGALTAAGGLLAQLASGLVATFQATASGVGTYSTVLFQRSASDLFAITYRLLNAAGNFGWDWGLDPGATAVASWLSTVGGLGGLRVLTFYPSTGVFLGTSPIDPGAGNLQTAGALRQSTTTAGNVPVVVSETVLGAPAASVTLTIPSAWRSVRIEYLCQSTDIPRRVALLAHVNSDATAAHYNSEGLYVESGTTTGIEHSAGDPLGAQIGWIAGTPGTGFNTGPGTGEIVLVGANVSNVSGSSFVFGRSVCSGNGSAFALNTAQFGLTYGPGTTFSYATLTLLPASGNFATGGIFRVIGTP